MAFSILKCPRWMIEYRVYRIPENSEEGNLEMLFRLYGTSHIFEWSTYLLRFSSIHMSNYHAGKTRIREERERKYIGYLLGTLGEVLSFLLKSWVRESSVHLVYIMFTVVTIVWVDSLSHCFLLMENRTEIHSSVFIL